MLGYRGGMNAYTDADGLTGAAGNAASGKNDVSAGRAAWQARYDKAVSSGMIPDKDFTTLSGVELEPVYGPDGDVDPSIGWPGEYPYTRGIHSTGYR